MPLFFVSVGAAVDVRVLNPLDPSNHRTLAVAGLLTAAAVAGKFAAGYAPFWFKGRKSLIGAGMIPRGEVGLIFARMGRDGGLLNEGVYAALTVVVLVTTFLAPPLLRYLAPPRRAPGFTRTTRGSRTWRWRVDAVFGRVARRWEYQGRKENEKGRRENLQDQVRKGS